MKVGHSFFGWQQNDSFQMRVDRPVYFISVCNKRIYCNYIVLHIVENYIDDILALHILIYIHAIICFLFWVLLSCVVLFHLVCTYTSYICTSEFSWWVLGKYCWRHKFLFTSISDHDVYWCRKGWIWRGQTILARHLNEKPEADTGRGDCWENALHKSKFEIVSCPAPLQLLPIQTQCFNEIGGFIPNKKTHGPWVLSFGFFWCRNADTSHLEFQWGKSLGSPFNNPSCGRANGSLGVPEIAGVWLVLRGPAFERCCFF